MLSRTATCNYENALNFKGHVTGGMKSYRPITCINGSQKKTEQLWSSAIAFHSHFIYNSSFEIKSAL